MSMRDAAAVIDGDGLEFEGVYEGWDADMIHGCLCDDGWEGYDCSLRYGCWVGYSMSWVGLFALLRFALFCSALLCLAWP